MKVTSIFTALMLLFATPVTASGDEVASCLRFVEIIEKAFDDRDAGLSKNEIETAVAYRLIAELIVDSDIVDSEDPFKMIGFGVGAFIGAHGMAEFIFSKPAPSKTEVLREAMSDCLEGG